MDKLDRHRLFRLKLSKNHHARQEALRSVLERPDGQWQGKVGGMVRGRLVVRRSRAMVEQEINHHYNDAMLAFVEGRKA